MMEEWTFNFHGTPVTYGVRGNWKYVVDLAASKVGKRKEFQRRCECTENVVCQHEEPVRQYAEKFLHDSDFPWSKIIAEAPIKIGSSEKLADVVVLKNENLPISSDNYVLIGEVKKGTAFSTDDVLGKQAKPQLISYMQNSNAKNGFIMCADRVPIFFEKNEKGEIVPGKVLYSETLEAREGTKIRKAKLQIINYWKEVLRCLDVAHLQRDISEIAYLYAVHTIKHDIIADIRRAIDGGKQI